MTLRKKRKLIGEVTIPGDKSISHRAVMLGSLAQGRTEVTNFLQGEDCLSTIQCFSRMGIPIDNHPDKNTVTIYGKGLHGLTDPQTVLNVGNSGTTIRLLSGILSGQTFPITITGDESIQRRPMGRIMTPLTLMGVTIRSSHNNQCAPLEINAKHSPDSSTIIQGIHYESPVASAQVKSCVLLAGLYGNGETSVTEPYQSRNHTEQMLSAFGATVTTLSHGTNSGPSERYTATITPEPTLLGQKIHVPGDISSAAYFIAAGLMVPNSEIRINNVGINPTRDGIIRICQQMGANIMLENRTISGGEPTADLIVKHSELTGTVIEGSIIPTLIDEIPIIAVLACYANGTTIIKDASELKVKESNRIDLMVENLKKMGADITATEDGMIIHGGKTLHGATIETMYDHRIAMSFAIAQFLTEEEVIINNPECIRISYPSFYEDLKSITLTE